MDADGSTPVKFHCGSTPQGDDLLRGASRAGNEHLGGVTGALFFIFGRARLVEFQCRRVALVAHKIGFLPITSYQAWAKKASGNVHQARRVAPRWFPAG